MVFLIGSLAASVSSVGSDHTFFCPGCDLYVARAGADLVYAGEGWVIGD